MSAFRDFFSEISDFFDSLGDRFRSDNAIRRREDRDLEINIKDNLITEGMSFIFRL